MTLKLYNSLTREKQKFIPKNPGEVRIYVCGMTVYGYCHIGHARMLVVFDVIVRWLRVLGYKTTYVRNITDVDDKIIRQAALNHESVEELTERFIYTMQEDCKALGLLAPDFEPKATEHIAQMIDMIKVLEDRGLAYLSGDGDVCFSVRKFPNYGQLSGKSLDQLRAGERVKVAHGKDDPLDFVLWKKAKPEEPQWPSPWGLGRPGWHIECSAMAEAFLGSTFDIHGGGLDLQFPHHENEIAQSDSAAGHVCVNYWLHNGFVRVDEEKMSKSTGNFITIRDVLAMHHPEVLRYLILRTHYRSPLNYSQSNLEDARHALDRLYTALLSHSELPTTIDWQSQEGQKFRLAMNDDFNTPDALMVLHELASQANLGNREAASQLFALGRILMLFNEPPRNYFQSGHALGEEEIEKQLTARLTARKSKKFAEADRIRDDLLAQGIVLEDTPDGTQWRKI